MSIKDKLVRALIVFRVVYITVVEIVALIIFLEQPSCIGKCIDTAVLRGYVEKIVQFLIASII